MNFDFLKAFPEMKALHNYCAAAEAATLNAPDYCALSSRKAMEYIVKMIYATFEKDPHGITVFEMTQDPRFEECVGDETILHTIHYIRKMGNAAAHDATLTTSESVEILEQLQFLVGEFCIRLGLIEDYPVFDAPTIQAPGKSATPADLKEKVIVDSELVAKYAPRMRNTKFNVKYGRNEEENKELFLRASLREAGWPIVNRPNQAMPNSVGINMILDDGDEVDYVLYGRDNRPLAIVERKTTSQNPVAGRMKALALADKMASKYGYKPIVYYTTGYEFFVIDQLGYPPRRVFQFHSISELELLILRRKMRTDISAPVIDTSIAGRKYQVEAITAACKAYASNRRHSLLVMATGTGKTRVSIALTDVLMKNQWVKNVLFLADRTSLVNQAHKNFTKLLSSVTTSVYSGASIEKDPNARIIFSTYQTMINLINDDTREFSIGRFDLIIIDEAHRSIFKKYGALFHYFDALMLGLTATPRSEDNKNTYEMFGLKEGEPDYAYELKTAIQEKHLVGFRVIDKTTEALKNGIHYDDLSPEDQQTIEDGFASGDSDIDLEGSVLKAKNLERGTLVNLGTIRVMLDDLMKEGLKIEGDDKIGKTIIFAASHFEAEEIVKEFQKLYPHLGDDFCKLIDSQVENNQALINTFGERGQMPQIAVSVDMLDTGIDVPDILNLVFFKKVQSKIKFLQMIGRGTRLSPNVFGPGMDKEGFLVFDYFENFEYFRTRNTWDAANGSKSSHPVNIIPQTILLNKRKLAILQYLQGCESLSAFDSDYRDSLKAAFVAKTRCLNNDDISVTHNMAYVSKYRTEEEWDFLHNGKVDEIAKHIFPLFPSEPDPVKVKNFDLLIYTIEGEAPPRMQAGQDVKKIRYGFGNVNKKLTEIMDDLSKMKTIPAITQKEKLINDMRDGEYLYDNFSLEKCEQTRKELRELMPFLPDYQRYFVVDFDDFVLGSGDETPTVREKTYVEKAMEFLVSGNPLIAKIQNLDMLTADEKQELEDVFKNKLGTAADYAAWSNNKPLLPFLRLQVGIEETAIATKFGSFYNKSNLTEDQFEYMTQMIAYARQNGEITALDLQKESPFDSVDVVQLFGEKFGEVKILLDGLHKPVM